VRVLLDECVDRRLAGDIHGHDVKTIPDIGWAALKNGELLARAEHEFEAFVTVAKRTGVVRKVIEQAGVRVASDSPPNPSMQPTR
jgi:hypothetical protein